MKKLIMTSLTAGIGLIGLAVNAGTPRLLTNYDELYNALNKGDNIRAVINLERCSISKPMAKNAKDPIPPPIPISGGLKFDVYNAYKFPDTGLSVIATSKTVLTELDKGKLAYNYVRLRVTSDNKSQIHSAIVNPHSFKQLGVSDISCAISNGTDNNGLFLYDYSS
jgi:hypothetical protein